MQVQRSKTGTNWLPRMFGDVAHVTRKDRILRSRSEWMQIYSRSTRSLGDVLWRTWISNQASDWILSHEFGLRKRKRKGKNAERERKSIQVINQHVQEVNPSCSRNWIRAHLMMKLAVRCSVYARARARVSITGYLRFNLFDAFLIDFLMTARSNNRAGDFNEGDGEGESHENTIFYSDAISMINLWKQSDPDIRTFAECSRSSNFLNDQYNAGFQS